MKNRIKVFFILPNLDGGGAEKVTINIIRSLKRNKFDIYLVLIQDHNQLIDLIPSHVKIIYLHSNKTIFSIFKLRKVFLLYKPDIVYSTLFRIHVAIYLAYKYMKYKPITIFRSPNSPKLIIENKKISFLMLYFLNKAYANAKLVIAQTPEMKRELIEFHKLDKHKIEVVLNPIDTDLIDEKIQNTKNPYSSSSSVENINVIAAGRLAKQKGFDILIKAFALVIKKNKNFRLYIIGNNAGEEDNLKQLVNELKLKENIHFLDFQENPYKFFKYADLYVLSSRWEGLPNTVLENLYLKRPIIATKCIPFMEELIENGKNGLLVDVNDIDALASSILKYKEIDSNYSSRDFNNHRFEQIFLNLMSQ